VWSYGLGPSIYTRKSIIGPSCAERIGEYTLIVGNGIEADAIPDASGSIIDSRVIIVDKRKRIVWHYGQYGTTGAGHNMLNNPSYATYIRGERDGFFNGSVLISDSGNNRILRICMKTKNNMFLYPGVNGSSIDQLDNPNSAQLLKNGNYLISDMNHHRALETTRHNRVVKRFTAGNTLGACAFASRLPNGNTLLTDSTNNKIIEVNDDDVPVWQYITNADPFSIPNPSPSRALRLKNGDTIISNQNNNQIIVVRDNVIVQEYGLPLAGGSDPIGPNHGYSRKSTQFGLYGPYDAKVIGDYTGLTNPRM